MAYSITYNAAFSTGPAKTEKLGLAYVHINDARVAFQERLKSEHEFDLTHNASQGFHKEGSARAFLQANAPTAGEQTALASATSDLNTGRVWVNSGNGTLSYQTLANANAAGWTNINAMKREGDTSTALAGNLVYNFLTYSDTLTHESQLIFKKSHWDTASHAVTLAGEALGSIWAYGDSGAAFTQAGYIQFVQNGAADAQTPADLVVYLSNGTATSEKLRISAAGLLTVADLTVTNTITGSVSGNSATVTVANEATDTTCFLSFVTAASGSLGVKTNAALTFNAATGSLGVGGTADTAARFIVTGTSTGAADRYGSFVRETIGNDVTSTYRGFQSSPSTSAASFTLSGLYHFFVSGSTVGSGSTVTNQYGFYVHSNLTGGGTNYGFYGLVAASGVARWNCYMVGTAPNYFNGKTYFSSSTDVPIGSSTSAAVQVNQLAGIPFGVSRWTADANGPYLMIGKSRGATVGSFTVVQSGDMLGSIAFCGDDGTDVQSIAASIECYVDGTPGSNDMPGALYFRTTPDGSAAPTTRMVLKQDGRLLLNAATSSLPIVGASPILQFSGLSGFATVGGASFSNDGTGARLLLGKSRGTSLGSYTVVQDGDELGLIYFAGADGTDLATAGAYIQAKVDGTPGANDLPTSLIFATTPDGASAPTEKLRITPDGRLYGTALHNNAGAVTGTTNQYIASGTYTPTFTAGTNTSATLSTIYKFRWQRVGNVVSCFGKANINCTGAGTVLFNLSLPIASNLAVAAEDLTGVANSTTAGWAGGIIADITNNEATVQFYGTGATGVKEMLFGFSYEVL